MPDYIPIEATLDIGEMRCRIAIAEQLTSQDASGAEVVTWQTIAKCWACIEPLQGRELYAAREIYPEVNTRFIIRWRSGIDPTMTIFWTNPRDLLSHQYDILGIADVLQRRQMMNIMAVERPMARNP